MATYRRNHRRAKPHRRAVFAAAVLLIPLAGCNTLFNGWLDPSVVGNFKQTATLEIRTSLTLEDIPPGIPGAVRASYDDLVVHPVDYSISPGDTLAVEVYELRERAIPFQAQAEVTSMGQVNLPVVGRIDAAGLTVSQFEEALGQSLIEQEVLLEPEVTVNPLFLQQATYSIFGIGVSASNVAPLRAGTFPIRRPDLRILEAINQVGGLNEFVSDVYVFRNSEANWPSEEPSLPGEEGQRLDESAAAPDDSAIESPLGGGEEAVRDVDDSGRTAEEELIEAVIEGDQTPEEAVEDESPLTDEVLKSLEPEPTDPYVYVEGKFVPNPVHAESSREEVSGGQTPPGFDAATPAVNWARIAGDTEYRVIRIPADTLREGDPESNIVIRAGDVIRIVSGEIGVYYVMGQVNRVGGFAFNAEPITLKAAIAAAGGLSSLAWPDRCTVYRRLGQREQMIQVDLDRIFAGKDPDFLIRRSDIINVGTHPLAPFLQRLRAWTLPNPTSNVGYSYTYARNFADIDSYSARINPHNEADRYPALFP